MTQPEQQEFTESLESALSWMQAIQERLKGNDNTQGPRDALEARLRETEKIHQSEQEGRMKMDKALVLAEKVLQSADEELKNHIQAKLKGLKSQWEETCTYITHCHSRIEWVWLHWNEYLKAYEEFELWLMKQRRSVDARVEMQLGVKEKLWQVDQQRVVVSDIEGQATLLERLLDEAAALHNRTQDASVDACAQERLQEAYNDVRERAKERLSLLQRIAEEHQMYQGCVQKFQSWLLSKTKELTDLMEKQDAGENKLKALQVLDDSVASEEKTLQHIEGVAEVVRNNTSPAGAEAVVDEAEELRLGWQRLRQGLCEAGEGLRLSLSSHSQYVARCQRLAEDTGRLRVQLQGLDHELENGCEAGGRAESTEEQMVGRWHKYTGVREVLTEEESQVELLKAQLKELFRFSEDSQHLSDDVLAVVKKHQSVKSRATRLCSESESGLKSILQDPLLVFAHWSHRVSQVLEASAEVTDFSHIAKLVQSIEHLLKDSVQLQERLSLLQVKGELLDSVFGPEQSAGLQDELTAAVRNRELLHTQLLQRRSRLQGLISRSKDFGEASQLIQCKLSGLRDRLVAEDVLQPDILAKKTQSDQFRVIQKDLEDCEAHLTAIETLVSSSQSNRTQFEKHLAEWRYLYNTVKGKVADSEESISDHESFHESLLNIEKWLMIMKQKLESFRSPSGTWSIEGREHEAEKALGEFPEKELQLQQTEIQGQGVLKRTSEDGRVHIQRDMTRLQESWTALYNTYLNIHGLLNHSMEQPHSGSRRFGGLVEGTVPTIYEGLRDSSGHESGGSLEGKTQEAGSGHFLNADELDSSASGFHSTSGRRSSPRRATEGSPGGDKSLVGCSSILGEDRAETMTRAISSSDGAAGRSSEGGVEPEGLSPRGGAFLPFRRTRATAPTQQPAENSGQYASRKQEFSAWLSRQNELLSGILSTSDAPISARDVKRQQDTLKALRRDVSWGQEQLQLLLQESQSSDTDSGSANDVGLEELRYRWMLYKSKLKEATPVRAMTPPRKPGLLQRACGLALLLWLLLLALLFLAFLLPLMDEGNSCSLSNNFARSFNVMLRYNGPPPT
ncbi:nesprin-3 [Betta splendens]|uniref:Nesprin-3 n=1 Tax=Betta splendens TaxID=158456 RepID=A0A6P7LMV9_BETSP|nr:nesprin-3 [Betta splendens]